MKQKKAARDGNKSRMLVHVPTEVQEIVRRHMGALGSTGGHAVMRLIQLGDAAYCHSPATLNNIRRVMVAEAGLANRKPAVHTPKARKTSAGRPSRAKAKQSTASPDAQN